VDPVLAAIQARTDAATEGDWWIEDSDTTWVLQGVAFRIAGDGAWPEQIVNKQILKAPKSGTPYAEYWPDAADAEFIAHARTDIPYLLAALSEARSRIEQLEAENEQLDAELQRRSRHAADRNLGLASSQVSEFAYRTSVNVPADPKHSRRLELDDDC
jgi:hypothetical protein